MIQLGIAVFALALVEQQKDFLKSKGSLADDYYDEINDAHNKIDTIQINCKLFFTVKVLSNLAPLCSI